VLVVRKAMLLKIDPLVAQSKTLNCFDVAKTLGYHLVSGFFCILKVVKNGKLNITVRH
jgi:hypothetical protein